jgi:hypothetical protein
VLPIRLRRSLWPLLTALAVFMIAVGVSRGDYGHVLVWARTLCTACIGLGR